MNNIVKNIFVGAVSTDVVIQNPLFKEENKLIITGGDRSDMILAALESDTAGIVLTNNLIPPSNVISKASEKGIPLLLISSDTFQTAKQIDEMEILLTKNEHKKIELLEQLIKRNIKLKGIDEI